MKSGMKTKYSFLIKKSIGYLSALGFALFIFGQGCGQVHQFAFSSSEEADPPSKSGNGGVYDGKLTFVHVVPGFTCEEKLAPKEVLYRDESKNWFLTVNEQTKCADQNRVSVSDVSYNGEITIVYREKRFVYFAKAPVDSPSLAGQLLQFKVDPRADPLTADANGTDGICADSAGLCSFRAAYYEASRFPDQIGVVMIPSGTYKFTTNLVLTPLNPLLFIGEDPATTIFDGQGTTSLFSIMSSLSAPLFENLRFQNAVSAGTKGSVIDAFFGSVILKNSEFHNNSGAGPAVAGDFSSKDIIVEGATFMNNQNTALRVRGASAFVVERSKFIGNKGYGIDVSNGTSNGVYIRQSVIDGNTIGMSVRNCFTGCRIEDMTVMNNAQYGIVVADIEETPGPGVYIVNSNITANAVASGSNIKFSRLLESPKKLFIQNSRVTVPVGGRPNCELNAGVASVSLESTTVDDSTCGP